MSWRDRVLYPFSERLDRAAIALGAAFAFAEMLLHGVTTCVDFFYLQDEGNENAEAVVEAARRVGIRLVLARSMYDWEGAPRRYRETVADATRRTRELITAHRKDATTLVGSESAHTTRLLDQPRGLTRMCARRLRAQQASLCSVQTGRSLP